MPRKPRIHFPGAVYHVMLRGNGGQDVFLDNADRRHFLLLLQEGTERFGCRIHAFCLMDNHLHLVIQVGDVVLARIMQNLGFRYTQYLNRKRKQTGHLFQGRYKSLLIDADNYLLELVRYVHVNPVRAGLSNQPDDYPWTSHAAYLMRQKFPWLTTDWVLGMLSTDLALAIDRYRRFIYAGLEEGYRSEFHAGTFEGRALGDDRFIEHALARSEESVNWTPTIEDVLSAVETVYQLTGDDLASRSRSREISEARAVAALLVRETANLTLTQLGKSLGVDVSSLSQAARRLEMRIDCPDLTARIEETKRRLPICQA